MAQKFTPGDLVKHQTGTTTMVVVEYKTERKVSYKGQKTIFGSGQRSVTPVTTDYVVCAWTDANNFRQTDTFHESELVKVDQ